MWIFPKIKEELRNRNIAYLEANGNIYLKEKGLFLWIEANNPVEVKDKTTNRAFTKTGLKAVYQFLINEECINYTYRKIAEETNTGIGNVNNIFTCLKQEGYLLQLNKEQYKLENKKKLLEKWIMEYEKRLKPTPQLEHFVFSKKMISIIGKSCNYKTIKPAGEGNPQVIYLQIFYVRKN